MRIRIVASFVFVMLVSILLIATPPPVRSAEFVIASETWDFPDEYGQGIEYVYFIMMEQDDTIYNYTYQFWNGTERGPSGNPAGLEVREDAQFSLRVRTHLNGTETGYTFAEGRDLYSRCGLKIYLLGNLLYSLTNLSQSGGSLENDPMWEYNWTWLLNGDPDYYGPSFQGGLVYTLVFNYDIFY